ncbi:ABC transporter permease [Pengzhenrongella sp.]|jgi:ABC-type transport system involved in multi-copper enzyme maturation permease subunit|uniref:ABC transporter permease n=1 Tax=Pengzhenrongella sp. TaxID=2888820 RepID=UPI002F93691D
MSASVETEAVGPRPGAVPPWSGTPLRHPTWGLSWHGVRTVAVLDLRQRVRSTRWIVTLVVWFVVVGAITGLTWFATNQVLGSTGYTSDAGSPAPPPMLFGPMIFGLVVFFVLFLGLLVSPTLSATAINGDRTAGTLATLQVTLLTPAEIAVGKLVAAWVAALAFLAASVPFLLASLAAGGTPVLAMIVCLLVLAVLLAVVCAIGLGFSALTARTSGSAVLTFLTVAGLTVLSPIVFGLTFPAITTTDQVRVWDVPANFDYESGKAPICQWRTETMSQPHTERTWWLLAINPFVIVADAAPQARGKVDQFGFDPLKGIRSAVREARTGPGTEQDNCTGSYGAGAALGSDAGAENGDYAPSPVAKRVPDRSAVWPWGLAANLLLGAAGLVTAVRRLTIPQRTLPRGTRVA